MSILLVVHITLASITFISGVSVWIKLSPMKKFWFRNLYISTISTGLLLEFGSPFTLSTCTKLGIYLLLILLTEYRLSRPTPNNSLHNSI